MLKRAENFVAMRQKTLKLRTAIDGVMAGCLLTLFFWGSLLLQCGDIEQNPGPKRDNMRQTSLANGGRRVSLEKTGSTSSMLNTPPPEKEPSFSDLMSMFKAMDMKFDGVKEDIKNIKESLSGLQAEVQTLKKEVANLQQENEELKRRIQDTERKTDDLEGRSKRNNLIFYGLPRTPDETSTDCEGIIKDMFVNNLEQTQDFAFDRVHRLNGNANSPIIARFTFFKDKEKILKAKYKLKGTKIFIGEDFSFRVRELRKKLLPFMKKARSEGKRTNMVFDHLIIEGKKFYLGEGETLREAE